MVYFIHILSLFRRMSEKICLLLDVRRKHIICMIIIYCDQRVLLFLKWFVKRDFIPFLSTAHLLITWTLKNKIFLFLVFSILSVPFENEHLDVF